MTSTQLALFDTSTVVVPYKEGDWVRLRKKPKNAFGLKRGDLIQIEKVHPTAGTIKFWNLASESYAYLYPDEVSLAPAPVDSVSESIALDEVDTESIAPVDSVSESIALQKLLQNQLPPLILYQSAAKRYLPTARVARPEAANTTGFPTATVLE